MGRRSARTSRALFALLLILAPAARGGTGVGTSAPATLDTRPPAIELGQPVAGEPLVIGEEYELLWSVVEEHFAAEGAVMTLAVTADGAPLLSTELEAEADGEYGYLWIVQADSSTAATWRVSAADLFGNAATAQSGSFLITDDETGTPAGAPERISLERSFPNPFNPVTTIRFALPAAAAVELAVYDVRGRRVALLFAGQKEAGRHSLIWDARGEASGVYFARLVTEGEAFTRKLVLLQ